MARVYDKTDALWTSRGDMVISGDGDILDTSFDPLRSLIQEVNTRIEADQGDWKNFPDVGSDISDFVGEANNKVTAEAIKTRIISALARDGFIHNADMKVKYMPIDRETIIFRLSLKVAPTASNRNSTELTQNILYNYSDNNVYFVR